MSSRELVEAPLGRGIALCHGPGEPPITSGEGRGVRSPSAFSAGEEMAEEGDSDPARLLLDRVVLKNFSSIIIGAVADWRSPSPFMPATMEVLLGVLRAVDVVDGGRSVTRVRPVLGARICQRGMYTGSVVFGGAFSVLKDGRLAFDSDEVTFKCAEDPRVTPVPDFSALLNSPGTAAGWGPEADSTLPCDDSAPSMVFVLSMRRGTD